MRNSIKILCAFALAAFSLCGQALKPDAKLPDAAKLTTPAAKSLSETQSLKMQVLLYKEQLAKQNAEVQTLKGELDILRDQISMKATDQVRTEQSSLAQQICRDVGVSEKECGQWLNAQIQKAFEPAPPAAPVEAAKK